jgi:transposase-like protein
VCLGTQRHYRVNHSKSEFSKWPWTDIHINGIENFWSFAKRRLAQFNGVKINFDLHLKECEWRYTKSTLEMERDLLILIRKYF